LKRVPETPYNVLLISFDTLRRDFVRAYGYRKAITPTIDRLARRGVLFRDAFANCGWTLPQHMTLVTGCEPIHHRMVEIMPAHVLGAEIPTLAQIFQKQGYVCLGFGNANQYATACAMGYSRGMSFYTDMFPANNMMERCVPLVSETLRVVGKRPFFMYFHTNDTHEPFAPSEPWNSKYGSSYVNRYEGQIDYADHYLGLILAELEHLGLAERTLIVFTSDHGTELEEHGHLEKKLNLYEEILQVPLILTFPGVLPCRREVSGFAQTSDIAPTILDLCSIAIPAAMDGRSLLPQIAGRKAGIPKTIFAHTLHECMYFYEHFAARTERYKFIRTAPLIPEPRKLQSWCHIDKRFERLSGIVRKRAGVWRELYDLRADPKERENVIDRKPGVARDLENQLNAWIRRHRYAPLKPVRRAAGDLPAELKEDERQRFAAYQRLARGNPFA
jgi:arylsulfatase A-like enzyme